MGCCALKTRPWHGIVHYMPSDIDASAADYMPFGWTTGSCSGGDSVPVLTVGNSLSKTDPLYSILNYYACFWTIE